MTISTSTGRSQYNGNGVTTDFNTSFKVFEESHVEVTLTNSSGTDTVLNITTHYTVALGTSSATVTMLTPPATGETLTLRLNVPLTQTYDLVNGQAFNADNIEKALDLGTQVDQSLSEELSRTLKTPSSVSSSFEGTLPSITPKHILRVNESGTGFEAVEGGVALSEAGAGTVNDLIFDLTPQLGGDLDVNDKDITGSVKLNGITYPSADGTNGQVLKTDGSGNVTFEDESGGFTYPSSDGDKGQILSTDGSGNLSFVDNIGDGPFKKSSIKLIKNGIDGHYGFNSGIFETDTEGKWVIVYRKAREHTREEGASIFAVDTYDNGQTFTNERLIFRDPSYDTRNFVTAKMNGRLGIIAARIDNSGVYSRAKFIYSDDDGVTWSNSDMPQGVGAVDTYHTNFHGNVVSYPTSVGGSDANGFVAYSYTSGSIDALYTTDNGANWTWAFDVVAGALTLTEMAVVRIGTQDKWVMMCRTTGDEMATSISANPISGWSTVADGGLDIKNNPVSALYEDGEVWVYGMSRKGTAIDANYPSHLMYTRVDGDTLYANSGNFATSGNTWSPLTSMPTWFNGYMFPVKIQGKWYSTITCGEVNRGGSSGPKTSMFALIGDNNYVSPPLIDGVSVPKKNLVKNGNFTMWTHGSSFSFTSATEQMIANGWYATGASLDTTAVLKKTFSEGQNEVQDNPIHYLNFKSSVVGGSGSHYIRTVIGRAFDYNGKKCNLSFWARMPSGTKTDLGRIWIRRNFGTGGSPTATSVVFSENVYPISTEWQFYSLNVDFSTIDGSTLGTNGDDRLELLIFPKYAEASSYELDITNVKLELGSTPSRFEMESKEEIIAKTGDVVEGVGTSGQVLTSNGVGSLPTFQDTPKFMELYNLTISIATGEIDISSQSAYGTFRIDTEALAATDDLDTITDSNAYDGKLIIVRQNASARDVTYKDGTGNLILAGDFNPGNALSLIMLSYYAGNWYEVSRSTN